MNCYELYYFFSRKNTGYVYVETELKIYEFIETDDFLDELVKSGKISRDFADHTVNVRGLREEEYQERKMTNEVSS